VRIAIHTDALEPPLVDDVRHSDPATLVEEVFVRTTACTALPALVVREIVENLVHARFAGATVTVLDGGQTVRVSDSGPGIADLSLAFAPGYSTAGDEERRVIRGVGSGLPLAADLMAAHGGRIDVSPNLRGGTVVTMSAPVAVRAARTSLAETARRLLALLTETGPSDALALAAELETPLAECGRELVVLEHRGLVARDASGTRSLTPSGSKLVATLF